MACRCLALTMIPWNQSTQLSSETHYQRYCLFCGFFWSLLIDTCILKMAFSYIASESGSSDSSSHMPSLSNTPSTSGTLVNTDPFSLLYHFLSLSIHPCLRPWTNFFHIPFLKKSIHTYMRSTARYSFTYFFPCSLLPKRNQYIHTCDPQLVTPLHTLFLLCCMLSFA